jgi:hypothetical protein
MSGCWKDLPSDDQSVLQMGLPLVDPTVLLSVHYLDSKVFQKVEMKDLQKALSKE